MDKQQDIVEVMARGIAGVAPGYGHRESALRALAALEQAGYAIVPVVATREMMEAGNAAVGEFYHEHAEVARWTAMLSARPSPLKIE